MTDEECDRECIGAETTECPDDLRAILEITGFQRDLLLAVAGASDTYPCGQTVRQVLEDAWEKEINESRVYQNLGELQQNDLVTSHPLDGRTKGYRVTDRGRALIRAYCSWALACLAEISDEETDENEHSDETATGS